MQKHKHFVQTTSSANSGKVVKKWLGSCKLFLKVVNLFHETASESSQPKNGTREINNISVTFSVPAIFYNDKICSNIIYLYTVTLRPPFPAQVVHLPFPWQREHVVTLSPI